ncbi:MAG: UDP-N-acetylmuramoyl-L-alanine--D-glutamate ligase, partial [Cytophagaceae bacterium]
MEKRLVILGAGESGVGAAMLGKAKGFDVFVSDMGEIKDKYRSILEKENIAYESGKHSEEKIMNAGLVIKSPGIPDKAPLIKALVAKGIDVVSEIEFAAH